MSSLEIIKRIDSLMEEYGVSNYVLAKESKITSASISRIRQGKQKAGAKSIRAIANYFKVNELWLKTGKGEKYLPKEEAEEEKGVEDILAQKVYDKLVPVTEGYQANQKILKENQEEIMRSLEIILEFMVRSEAKSENMEKSLGRIEKVLKA